jgi:hypothetical protein
MPPPRSAVGATAQGKKNGSPCNVPVALLQDRQRAALRIVRKEAFEVAVPLFDPREGDA